MKERLSAGHVYIVGNSETKTYKIGRTSRLNPAERIASIQQGVPFELDVIHTWPCRTDSREIEHRLHVKFADRHIRGEWFRFEDSELQPVIDFAAELAQGLNIPLYYKFSLESSCASG